MDADNNRAKLFFKILAVQKSLQPLEKSGKNDYQRYAYSTAGDVLLPVQKACNEQGLIAIADVIESHIEPGKASATVRLTVADSETGESVSITAPGYAEDWSYKENRPTGDKAIYKAITGATKYAVRSFFCLPSEDEPERTIARQNRPISNSKPASKPNTTITALIDQTTEELKRLGWSSGRGRLYLQEKFDKSSRQELTQQELQQFLTQLKAMSTPTVSDTRAV